MRSHALYAGTILAATLTLTGCATTLRGPADYIRYPYDGKAVSATTSANVGTYPKMQTTYEDEFVYDAAGNLVKHKQTEYFNYDSKTPAFVVWETEYKVIGGVVLPYRQTVNGEVYAQVDYDQLTSQNKGVVQQGTLDRQFSIEYKQLFKSVFVDWSPELSQFAVDFPADGKYVVTKNHNNYYGSYTTNVLTPGYDNIVLKHYSYSYSTLVKGFNKSFQWGLFHNDSRNFSSSNSEFNFEWKAVAKGIVQTKATFQEVAYGKTTNFEADADYNDAGQRTHEIWTAFLDKGKPVTLFEQTLKY
jgi:hypothetical protein